MQVTTIRGFDPRSLKQEMRISSDPVANLFIDIDKEFNLRFKRAFHMNLREDDV
jgi:hypothetical protein